MHGGCRGALPPFCHTPWVGLGRTVRRPPVTVNARTWHLFCRLQVGWHRQGWEIGEGQDCLDNIGNLVAAIRHAERHAVTTIVGPDGEDMTIESGIKRRPAYNVCDVLSLIYTNLRRYTDLSAALHVRFRDDLLAVTRRSDAFAAGVPRMAPNPLYPRSRASFASGRRCCSLFLRVTCCGTRTVLPCTGSAMFQVEMS